MVAPAPSSGRPRTSGGREGKGKASFVRSSCLVRSDGTTHTKENPIMSTTADTPTRNGVDAAAVHDVVTNGVPVAIEIDAG
jgi:hypothetical protein